MTKLSPSDFSGNLDPFGETSRRIFVKGLGFVGVSLLLATTLGGCEKLAEQIRNRPLRRRIRPGSAAVDADVATYANAVQLMKNLQSDPRSWLAQATIHGTATQFTQCQHGTNHFFDWHRAYLLFFEKICQKLTNQPKFGLPYWNWNQNPDVPAAYLNSASPLFSPRGQTTTNGNSSVSSPTLDVIFDDTNFFSFSTQIEGTPHNSVHGWIGGTLGNYNSPLDPLFWNHHCMVDYCWYKWNVELGNQNTNDQNWLGAPNGQFVDGDGNPATATAATTILMPLLAYRYESSAIGKRPAKPEIRAKSEYKKVEERLRAGAPIRFAINQRARIAERADLSGGKAAVLRSAFRSSSFSALVENASTPQRIFLSVGQANVPQPTDVYVRVFVNLPTANAETPTDDPHFAGSFAFFGNPAQEHHAGDESRPRFLVDLTHTLRSLRERGDLAADVPLTVQLVPTPMGERRELEGRQLVLSGVDIITTPVIVSSQSGQGE